MGLDYRNRRFRLPHLATGERPKLLVKVFAGPKCVCKCKGSALASTALNSASKLKHMIILTKALNRLPGAPILHIGQSSKPFPVRQAIRS